MRSVVFTCPGILKSGVRKGQICNRICKGSSSCGYHKNNIVEGKQVATLDGVETTVNYKIKLGDYAIIEHDKAQINTVQECESSRRITSSVRRTLFHEIEQYNTNNINQDNTIDNITHNLDQTNSNEDNTDYLGQTNSDEDRTSWSDIKGGQVIVVDCAEMSTPHLWKFGSYTIIEHNKNQNQINTDQVQQGESINQTIYPKILHQESEMTKEPTHVNPVKSNKHIEQSKVKKSKNSMRKQRRYGGGL